jgi:hypothetical protein
VWKIRRGNGKEKLRRYNALDEQVTRRKLS